MLHLISFLDELRKIAANAMAPPSSAGALGMPRIPGPGRLPSIDEHAAMGANYKMHMPTVFADMQQRNLAAGSPGGTASGATPTIPAPAGTLPQAHPTMPAPRPSILGAPMSQRNVTTAITHMPTVRPAAAAGALGKLKKPLGGVLQAAAHAA